MRILELISGIISFILGSILHADELSITIVPLFENFGAHFKEISLPAEKSAMSALTSKELSIPITGIELFLKFISLPADFSDAIGKRLEIGKFLSSNCFSISLPTIPVAPTTATFIFFFQN